MEESHNGIAAVLKTADRKVVGVRVSLPPPNARMVKLEYTSDLGSDAEMRGGSSPSSGTQCGSNSMVESQPSKLLVASSSLVFRSQTQHSSRGQDTALSRR